MEIEMGEGVSHRKNVSDASTPPAVAFSTAFVTANEQYDSLKNEKKIRLIISGRCIQGGFAFPPPAKMK